MVWVSVVDARVIYQWNSLKLATLDQAVAALEDSTKYVGFRCYCEDGAARWSVSFEVLGMTCGSCVSILDRALRAVE